MRRLRKRSRTGGHLVRDGRERVGADRAAAEMAGGVRDDGPHVLAVARRRRAAGSGPRPRRGRRRACARRSRAARRPAGRPAGAGRARRSGRTSRAPAARRSRSAPKAVVTSTAASPSRSRAPGARRTSSVRARVIGSHQPSSVARCREPRPSGERRLARQLELGAGASGRRSPTVRSRASRSPSKATATLQPPRTSKRAPAARAWRSIGLRAHRALRGRGQELEAHERSTSPSGS